MLYSALSLHTKIWETCINTNNSVFSTVLYNNCHAHRFIAWQSHSRTNTNTHVHRHTHNLDAFNSHIHANTTLEDHAGFINLTAIDSVWPAGVLVHYPTPHPPSAFCSPPLFITLSLQPPFPSYFIFLFFFSSRLLYPHTLNFSSLDLPPLSSPDNWFSSSHILSKLPRPPLFSTPKVLFSQVWQLLCCHTVYPAMQCNASW